MLRRSSIRRSTDADLKAVLLWLEEQDRQGIEGNFWCNRGRIQYAYEQDELIVYIDGRSGDPVAFQLGGLVTPGILQVRHAYRDQGIGTRIVRHCIARAQRNNQPLLRIQCKPRTSIPFWKRMGFTLFDGKTGFDVDHSDIYAYRILEQKLPLPDGMQRASIRVRFFPEERKWLSEDKAAAFATFAPEAVLLEDGSIQLAERVCFHEYLFPKLACGGNDTVVEIDVDGVILYRDKAKYDEASAIGIQRCTNGFYIDAICKPSSKKRRSERHRGGRGPPSRCK